MGLATSCPVLSYIVTDQNASTGGSCPGAKWIRITTMLHTLPEETDFDVRRQLGELESLVASTAGSTYVAEGYTGWPSR